MLEVMKGAAWERQFELYSAVLDRIPERLMEQAVRRLAGEQWRPAPYDILREAARIEMANRAGTASAYPSADEAYGEIVHKIRRFGVNGRVADLGRPHCLTAGAPSFSHPLVARTVALIGGWEMLCTGEASYAEGLAKQIKGVYERQAALWMDGAAASLGAGDAEDARYFPRWTPWETAAELWALPPQRRSADAALLTSERRSADAGALVPCPAEIRAKLAAVGVRLVR